MMQSKIIRANFLLLLTAIIWGGGFVAQRFGMNYMRPFIFNGFRFTLGVLTLLPVVLLQSRPGRHQASWKSTLTIGLGAGFFLFFGATFQQLGLLYTTAGKAGFVTGLYLIIVPLLGLIWGDRVGIFTWLGALLAVVGLYFLSVTERFTLSPGDGYVLVGAFFWAGHVQFIAHFSRKHDPIRLSLIQALLTAVLSFTVGFIFEDFSLAMAQKATIPIIYGGVVSIGLAYTLQVVAQQIARPSHAAILLSMEAVFAVFWGWLILNESLPSRGMIGSGLMLGGMLLSQLSLRSMGRENKNTLPPGEEST